MSSEVFVEKEVTPEPKRIIICCDGTWQSATSLDPKKNCPSNVSRMTRVLANAGKDKNEKVWQQIVYYDAGIGTGDLTEYEKHRQGTLGKGLVENILEAYNFIANNYNPGDQLFFFGFSRGAYTVRATAGLICQLGVLLPAHMPAFIKLYAGYMDSKLETPGPFNKYRDWVTYMAANAGHAKTVQKDVKIQVIGVWDTVGSLGVPELGHFWTLRKADLRAYQFYDTDLNPQILHAYQALALDEQRKSFAPAIWKLPPGETSTELIQCWFPGVHVNVGGGSTLSVEDPPRGDREQLSSVTFAWMCDRIRPHLALSESALDAQIAWFKNIASKPDGPVKYSLSNVASATTSYLKSFIWTPPKSVIKPGYALGPILDNHGLTYDIMAFPEPRTPSQTNFYETKATNKERFSKTLTDRDFTFECIHPSVWYRDEAYKLYDDTGYKPAALDGWQRMPAGKIDVKGDEKGERRGWVWAKLAEGESAAESSMPEFEIVDMGKLPDGREISVERRLIQESVIVRPIHEESAKAWIVIE